MPSVDCSVGVALIRFIKFCVKRPMPMFAVVLVKPSVTMSVLVLMTVNCTQSPTSGAL